MAWSYTESGNNTASTSWAISTPALVAGDVIVVNLAWDDSTNTTSVSAPAGPNSESANVVQAVQASDSTACRGAVWYYQATGNWSAGTLTFTPNASEQWTAVVIKIPKAEVNQVTPIGASNYLASTTTGNPAMPSLTAGSTDGTGTVVGFMSVDTDDPDTTVSGWTARASTDRGAIGIQVETRDAAATDSESISSATGWTVPTARSWVSFIYIVRTPRYIAAVTPLTTTLTPTATTPTYSAIFLLALSSNFANGDATTNQLSVASGFVAGKMSESSNPMASIDLGSGEHTEIEWNFKATASAEISATYEFRVTNNGSVLDVHEAVPEWTVTDADVASVSPLALTLTVASVTADYTLDTTTISYLQSATDTSDTTTYTFSSQNFGTADDDRYIIIGIHSRKAGAASSISSVTIGGVSASITVENWNAITNADVSAIVIAKVTTGTSGDVVITFADTMLRCAIGMWRATGITGTTAYDTDVSDADDPTVNLDVPEGFAIGVATTNSSTSNSWTGVTENYDSTLESFVTFTGGFVEVGSLDSGRTITADFAAPGTESAGAFASWAYGAGIETASVTPLTTTLTPVATTATYIGDYDAVAPVLTLTTTITTTTATYLGVYTAGISPVTTTLTPTDTTATYVGDYNAVAPVLALTLTPTATTTTYASVLSATANPVITTLTPTSTTATYVLVETASVAPLALTLTANTVTATAVSSASVEPLVLNIVVSSTTATYVQVETASVAPISALLSVVGVTTSYTYVSNASVAPVTANITVSAVTATYIYITTATAPVVTSTLTVTNHTATYVYVNTASVAPLVLNLTPTSTTASYSTNTNAGVIPLSLTLTPTATTANYVYVTNASVAPLVINLTPTTTSASYSAGSTAGVIPLLLSLTPTTTTADYESVLTATVIPLPITLTAPSITGLSRVSATVDPLLLALSTPNTTATHSAVFSGDVEPVSLSLSINPATPTFILNAIAVPEVLNLVISLLEVSATSRGTSWYEGAGVSWYAESVPGFYTKNTDGWYEADPQPFVSNNNGAWYEEN